MENAVTLELAGKSRITKWGAVAGCLIVSLVSSILTHALPGIAGVAVGVLPGAICAVLIATRIDRIEVTKIHTH